MDHFLHEHPLQLTLKKDEDGVSCSVCNKQLSDDEAYGCSECEFLVHKSCAQLPPEIEHILHPCPLILTSFPSGSCGVCNARRSNFVYHCPRCSFSIDLHCAELPLEMEHIFHPSCPVILTSFCGGLCIVCNERRSGFVYHCPRCTVSIDVQCAELPLEIDHFLHPCSIILTSFAGGHCGVCGGRGSDFVYHCPRCSWNIDLECVQLPALTSEQGMQELLQHFSHEHPLTFFRNMHESQIYCQVCGHLCLDHTCGCRNCNFYLHRSCMDNLPRKIRHFSHLCPLLLCRSKGSRCGVCDNLFSGLSFLCSNCDFQLDVECALQPTLQLCGGHERIRHISHRHPLDLKHLDQHDDGDDEVFRDCKGCGNDCSSGPVYCCQDCKFCLHKKCAELPGEIQNDHHPSHLLTLSNMASQNSEQLRCRMCGMVSPGFAFHCHRCNFQLGVECLFAMPSVKFVGHNHHLTVVEKAHREPGCGARACKRSFSGSPVLSCADCNFVLHIECGPLPTTIKHECHVHPLFLRNYFIDDDYDDEFYCDICEEERDPRLCVYYCPECYLVADVNCVISEVLAALRGECGNVVLRVANEEITSKNRVITDKIAGSLEQNEQDNEIIGQDIKIKHAMCFNDLLDFFSDDEKKEFEFVCRTVDCKADKVNEETPLEVVTSKVSPYSDLAFTQLMERLDSDIGIRFESISPEYDEELVNFGQYMVPRIYIPIMKQLDAKYRDVSDGSPLSPRVKSVLFACLCEVIRSMRTTLVEDIKESQLGKWWRCSKLVLQAEFGIQFVFDHLRHVSSAYFGLKAASFANGTRGDLEKEIAGISEEIKELTLKREETERQLKSHLTYVESATSSSMRQHLNCGKTMRYKSAADGLL